MTAAVVGPAAHGGVARRVAAPAWRKRLPAATSRRPSTATLTSPSTQSSLRPPRPTPTRVRRRRTRNRLTETTSAVRRAAMQEAPADHRGCESSDDRRGPEPRAIATCWTCTADLLPPTSTGSSATPLTSDTSTSEARVAGQRATPASTNRGMVRSCCRSVISARIHPTVAGSRTCWPSASPSCPPRWSAAVRS